MDYGEVMGILSECEIGAALVEEADWRIREINEAGVHFLQGADSRDLVGRRLSDLAEALCEEEEEKRYACIGFRQYLVRCPGPRVQGLPEGCRLVTFRRADQEVLCEMYEHALEQASDAVILCDAQSRISFLNNACIQMDGLVPEDVIGEKNEAVYEPLDGEELIIPRAIREKRVFLNRRQIYTTRYHKNVDITANTYPIVRKGQVLGGYSIMKDWSAVDSLNKKILELQAKLLDQNNPRRQQRGGSALSARYHFEDIIHISSSMDRLLEQCRRAAQGDSSVMLYGETGTGKELLAQSIHNASRRADGPFLALNCAAIPENLLEGLLFGTEKGAYTGAERRPGYLEQANGGSLLLDELNSMNINLQAKLLRVLQDGMVRRVGGTAETHVDVRVLSILNIPPRQAIQEGKLRQDLFYRLGVVNLTVPPLRERREDILLLARHFIMKCNARLSRNVRGLEEEVLPLFQAYSWPGNVRELEHVVEHAINILPDGMSLIPADYLPDYLLEERPASPQSQGRQEAPCGESLTRTIQDVERNAICATLREHGGNISEAARALKMSRQNLQYRIRKYKIRIEEL